MTADRVFVLPSSVRRALIAHARAEQPHECCGFLLGTGRRAAFAVPMPNAAASAVRYRVDDRAHIELRRILRGFTPPLSIVGVYHSHPDSPAVPSPTDIVEAHYPEWVYVIVSLAGARPLLGAFRIGNGRARRVAVRA